MTAVLVSGATFRAALGSPGRLYNLGNAIALIAGIGVAVASRPRSGGASLWSAGADYLMGSRSAALMTMATVFFLASGEFYATAFRRGTHSSFAWNQIRLGDLLSGLGAILLAAALACVGDPTLAAVSGILNAGGKLGSAYLSGPKSVERPRARRLMALCRLAPFLSRLPAAAAALGGLLSAGALGDPPGLVLSTVMLGCYVLWGAADALLIAGEHASASSMKARQHHLAPTIEDHSC